MRDIKDFTDAVYTAGELVSALSACKRADEFYNMWIYKSYVLLHDIDKFLDNIPHE